MMAFLSKEENHEEAVKLGLLEALPEAPTPLPEVQPVQPVPDVQNPVPAAPDVSPKPKQEV